MTSCFGSTNIKLRILPPLGIPSETQQGGTMFIPMITR
jgi:hypothetical protein